MRRAFQSRSDVSLNMRHKHRYSRSKYILSGVRDKALTWAKNRSIVHSTLWGIEIDFRRYSRDKGRELVREKQDFLVFTGMENCEKRKEHTLTYFYLNTLVFAIHKSVRVSLLLHTV